MYIAILGRQPELGAAELERLYGSASVSWCSNESVLVESERFDLSRLGGTQKAGRVILKLPRSDWRRASMKLVQYYEKEFANFEGKLTLGLSAYDMPVSPRDVQKTGLVLKSKLKAREVSVRLIPNQESALNTATSHHNKLGLSDNKRELLFVRSKTGDIIIAESIGAQNITAYTKRDQGRPKRDAFVGMLPPKLAQIITNLAAGDIQPAGKTLLDPFCGTGVVLQEAALMGFDVYGTDLAEKMVDFSQQNFEWLQETHRVTTPARIEHGDVMDTKWRAPLHVIACESYLGQPFSAPPSKEKLTSVQKNCEHIIGSFLKNIASQTESGTRFCVAVPAWRNANGEFTHLPLTRNLEAFGFTTVIFETAKRSRLLYYRDDQVVARELLVFTKA